jgi:hypothetical protein
MQQELASISLPARAVDAIEGPLPLPLRRATLPDSGLSPRLRSGSVDPFAVRNDFRSSPALPSLTLLQKCSGITFVGAAWLLFLFGLANLILAALHNQQGELGLGVESTLYGAKCCLAGLLFCAVGVPQWVMAERRLDARSRS